MSMRKVKILVPRVGATSEGVTWAQDKGDIVDLPEDEAANVVRAKHGVYLDEKPEKK